MSSGPHLVIVGSEVGRILTGQGEGDGESRRVPQKIFEVSSSGFMTEQSVATGGAGSGSALLILENSKLDMKVRDKPASASKTMKRIRKILEALRAADSLGVSPQVVNLGGGFGIPYTPDQHELELGAVAEELDALGARAPATRLMLELGRYIVGPSGWYLTRVLGQQTHKGRPAVVVDGGTHQRADLCGLGLRCGAASPVALIESSQEPRATDILGSLSLPDDVLAEDCALPPLAPGDIVAFPNAGAYGLCASPALFHGHPLPAEVIFDGETIVTIRERGTTEDLLKGQARP